MIPAILYSKNPHFDRAEGSERRDAQLICGYCGPETCQNDRVRLVSVMAKKKAAQETAESLAQKQRDISVSEFFLKNRHLLGFDNPRKALLTTIKEAVDNALDACEESSIAPEISVRIIQLREKRFRVHVMDNGPGMNAESLENCFAPYYSTKKGGQGLGLAISRRFVEDHGGGITVESQEGTGTRFQIWVPSRGKVSQDGGDT